MTRNEHPRLGGQFGLEIQVETSRMLRHGRRMKMLSIIQAAKELEMSPFHLKALEDGTAHQSLNIVSRVLRFYGFNEFAFMNLFNELMLEKSLRERNKKERAHLSMIGGNPKPWEDLPESLSAARRGGYDGLKC